MLRDQPADAVVEQDVIVVLDPDAPAERTRLQSAERVCLVSLVAVIVGADPLLLDRLLAVLVAPHLAELDAPGVERDHAHRHGSPVPGHGAGSRLVRARGFRAAVEHGRVGTAVRARLEAQAERPAGAFRLGAADRADR